MSRAKVGDFEDELEILLGRVKDWIGSEKDADVARALNVSSSSIPTWRKRGTVPYGDLVQWAYRNDVSMDWLFYGGPHDPDDAGHFGDVTMAGFSLIPRYDVRGSMGNGEIVQGEIIVDHLAFNTDWIRHDLNVSPDKLALITATGDSMEPSLASGDLILIDTAENEFMDDAIYVLGLNGCVLIKRIQRMLDGSVIIKSDNPAYREQIINKLELNELKIVGRVVWAGKRM